MIKKIKRYLATASKNLGLGKNGTRRLYWKGQVEQYGFLPGTRYDVQVKGDTLTLVVNAAGKRVVSKREVNGKLMSIIDIENNQLLELFDGMDQVRVIYQDGAIHVLPLATVVKVRERLGRLRDNIAQGFVNSGSLATGVGVMALALHMGLGGAGIQSNLAFAVEIREDMLDHAYRNNPVFNTDTMAVIAPMQEAANDQWLMSHLPKVDILELSIPCSGASVAGRAKNKTSCAEAHEDVGHLIAPALQILAAVNPSVVIFENVIPYRDSASGYILRYQLRDLGYEVSEIELSGEDFNSFENRKRWCVVGVTHGVPFDFAELVKPAPETRHLASILDAVPSDDKSWSEMAGLKAKEVRDKEAGKGFAMQIYTGFETKINTITKGYAKVRSTDPKIAHPTDTNLLRQLTPAEHARIKGIPEFLVAGMSNTIAHEALGQSVLFEPFKAVGSLVGDSLNKWFNGKEDSNGFKLARAAA